MGKILLKNIRCYSFHGCLKEETAIGSDYRVDLSINADLKKSAKTDQLKDTVDYVLLNRVVKEEMGVPSKLLENVAHRIIASVFKVELRVNKCSVQITKLNPPINGDVVGVSVKLTQKKDSKF
ncbi:dihydroneopterin aldolase [Flavobacteriaceae bacterium]|nr:dihydroneopterin aldolase [Flavobacteriaceae bacterium]